MTLADVLYSVVIPAAGASSLALAAFALARRPRGRVQWTFAAGMVAFAAETFVIHTLLTTTELPEERRFWLQIVELVGLVLPLPWALFVAALAYPAGTRLPRVWQGTLGGVVLVSLAGAVGLVAVPAFQIADVAAPFYAARLGPAAHFAVVVQLLVTVSILAGLEECLRAATRDSFWRIKYLVLGLGAIFLGRFYFLSQTLLFHVIMGAYFTAGTAVLLVGNATIAGALVRAQLREAELTVSRRVLFRSVVVGVLGLYLLVVGALGWLLARLNIPEELFWGSLLVFVSALGLAALLLSEEVRWRVKRFISLHFYRSKYDYREQWINFTKRLGSLLSLEQLAPHLVVAVAGAVGAAKAALYLADPGDGSYRLAGSIEVGRPAPVLDAHAEPIETLARAPGPTVLDPAPGEGSRLPLILTFMPPGSLGVPLRWQGALVGVMLIGPERTGRPYGPEDVEFLATVGEQAAGAIMTARLSESLARSREFEAFHRLTSFVVHDLKNSISALSMLSQNALEHFDDPEFQRDAIKTLSRTVERMKGLLARLASTPAPDALNFQPVDLAALALEATRPLGGGAVHLVKELAPVPPVQGDPDALLRVIQNLVNNAVESLRGQGGMVTVKTSDEQGWVVFAVSDTGCGMSEEFLRTSLFAPFRSTKRGGWGVGLYHAKGLVEAHRGRLEVCSTEGRGTTFQVKLPVERES
jgi:hypothetical protein